MKLNHKFHLLSICLGALFLMSACDQDYDPIGNNKPSPLLSVSPASMAFDGTGGEMSAEISTNVEGIEVGEKPSWIESIVVSEDRKTITVKAAANTDPVNYRNAVVSISTKSEDDNQAVQYLRFVQGAQNAKLNYESFAGKRLPESWAINGNTTGVTVNGVMTVPQNTYVLFKDRKITQADNRVICTVDVKGGQGGLITYVNDDANDTFLFAFSINSSKTQGFFFAAKKGGTDPMAMDNFPTAGMDAIPEGADDYFRIEFTSASKYPNWWQAQVTVYSLKNKNGLLTIAGKHYTRQFEIDGPKPKPGYFGVICRPNDSGSSMFKDFTLSAPVK